jgi:hypothetical protein
MAREFSVVIERDADGYYMASVPALRGCHTMLVRRSVPVFWPPSCATGRSSCRPRLASLAAASERDVIPTSETHGGRHGQVV